MQHDFCMKTLSGVLFGQNLWTKIENGIIGISDTNATLQQAINLWFEELKFATLADINNCCGGPKLGKIGHFTQVVRDKADSVGCAMSKFTSFRGSHTLITCDYSYGNLIGTPVYVVGETAAQCSNGTDTKFTNLCQN